MASHKHRSAFFDALSGNEIPIETISQELLSLIRVEASSHCILAFSNEKLEGATYTRSLQITIECMGSKVPMVLINNGFTLNVCPFRTAFTIGLDVETIIPSPLTIRVYDNSLRKVMGTFKSPCKIGPLDTIVEFHVMDITPKYKLL